MSRKKRPGLHISEIIERLSRVSFQNRLTHHKLFCHWKDVVGNELARISEPAELKGNRLKIAVKSSIWMFQLNIMKRI